MPDEIFTLSDLPLARPIILREALKRLDPRLLSGATPSLGTLVEQAIRSGEIRAARAEVPSSGVETFVDLNSFPAEVGRVIEKSGREPLAAQPAGARAPIANGGSRWTGAIKRSLKSAVGMMVANRTLRPIVEAPCSRVEQYVRLALLSPFAPSQILGEICGLLQLLAERSPKDLLEIGTSEGGTLYLLTRVADPAASLVSIDLHLPDPELLASFARRRQRITPIEGDSTAPATRQRAGEQFPSGVDFLFIDGDHSYEGVKKDFELYSPLVRPGGLIAFHDIVDDNETRYGVITGGWAGGVPRFWREVKPQFQHVEFVRDYEQDGYGIGVLFTPR